MDRGSVESGKGKNDQGLVSVGTIRPAVSACRQLRKLGFSPTFLRCWLQQTVHCLGSLEFFQAGPLREARAILGMLETLLAPVQVFLAQGCGLVEKRALVRGARLEFGRGGDVCHYVLWLFVLLLVLIGFASH